VQIAIAELAPKVQELQANGNRASSTAAILDLLRSANLGHVLPSPGPLAPRKFHVSTSHLQRLHNVLTIPLVVRCLARVAQFTALGRDLRTRNNAPRCMERDQRPPVRCQAYTTT
jgi:anthranilate/para-aminobenzoate synthase component II